MITKPKTMRTSALKSATAILLLILQLTSGAQQPPSPSKRETAVKQQADRLSPGSKISIVLLASGEDFGTFLSNDQQGLTFYDVDRKTQATVEYSAIKKIKRGYGGYNFVTQKHVDRTRNLIVAACVLGGLGVLIAAAAASK